MKDIISNLTPEQALEIVHRLANKAGKTGEIIRQEAKRILEAVDIDEVAEEVFFGLDMIDVQDCWDRSVGGRDGYISPDEAASELIEEEIDPFFDQAKKYHDLEMFAEEKSYCMGVLLGVYRFDHESKSEFRDWAEDISLECACILVDQWRKRNDISNAMQEMNDFIRRSCPKWQKYMIKEKTEQ